ncbi:MAG TPA: hypothetical protein VFH91_08685, partial [Pyrinomonadaceae bacterium]|nr:hypothetical protein [Pyrinomonadaceae bacterium]
MNRFFAIVTTTLLIAALSTLSFAQTSPPPVPTSKIALFNLEDLRPGMKGTARTVFSGTETEEFGV